MAKQLACPTCGTALREIVWGYGTLADVTEAGDVVIGGCVIDVDAAGRVAALQCPACGTRTDAAGAALERPEPPATTTHPFAVAFSNPQPSKGVVSMTEAAQPGDLAGDGAEASPYVEEDFGGIAAGGDWRDHVQPYASREDALPVHGTAWRDNIDAFAPGAGLDGTASDVDARPEAAAEAAPPAPAVDSHALDTSDFTDAEEEGWPPSPER